jgi:hypothetical protein
LRRYEATTRVRRASGRPSKRAEQIMEFRLLGAERERYVHALRDVEMTGDDPADLDVAVELALGGIGDGEPHTAR